jgi:hypothetical protein
MEAEAKHVPVARLLPRSKPAQCFEHLADQITKPLDVRPQSALAKGLARLASILRLRPDETEVPQPISPRIA